MASKPCTYFMLDHDMRNPSKGCLQQMASLHSLPKGEQSNMTPFPVYFGSVGIADISGPKALGVLKPYHLIRAVN